MSSVPQDKNSARPSGTKAASKRVAAQRGSSHAASNSLRKKASASSATDYVKFSRAALEFQIVALQAQLDLLNGLSKMSDDEKLNTLYEILDKDGDGQIDAHELADGLRKCDESLAFADSLQAAVAAVATFDTDDDARLNKEEFRRFLDTLLDTLGCNFHDLSELLVMQILFSDSGNNQLEDAIGEVMSEPINEAVRETEAYRDVLLDDRMVALYNMFDLNGDGKVEFKEVALGLFKMTDNMEESSKAAMAALLMFDEDSNKTLDYLEFSKLIMNVVYQFGEDFEELIDDMLKCASQPAVMSDEDLALLVVGDEMATAATELADLEKEVAEVINVVEYGRMQRLFDLWDLDHDGTIDFSELALGMRKFHEAKSMEDTLAETVAAMLTFDENDDQKLDRVEFAVFLAKFSKAAEVDLHELIDFMVVASALKDDDEAEKAFINSIAASATDEIKGIEDKLKSATG